MLLDIFINRLPFERVCPDGKILSYGPGSFGLDFMYKGARLHLSIADDNRVWISYVGSYATIIANKCDTIEELEDTFRMLDELYIRKDS